MKVLFMGGHTLGRVVLDYLLDMNIEIVGVFTTLTDDPWYAGVEELAKAHGLTLWQGIDVNEPSLIQAFKALRPDLIVSVNFNQILKHPLIELPPKGCINIHAGLLPKYRGRAPLNWAIINGESCTGVTVHFIDKGVDSGDILLQWQVTIRKEDTIAQVYERVERLYPLAVFSALKSIESGVFSRKQQVLSEGFICKRRTKEDGRISWNQSAVAINNLVRGVTRPYPGAYTVVESAEMIIWSASVVTHKTTQVPGTILSVNPMIIATGDGGLKITDYEVLTHGITPKVGDICE